MSRLPIHNALCLVAVLAAGCERAGPIEPGAELHVAHAAGGASAAQADKQVPFRGTFTYTDVLAPGGRCPTLTDEIRGTGYATHLGRFTTVQSHCVAPPSLAFTDGRYSFTAANGDQMRGTYSGVLVPLAPPVYAVDGRWTITGGTGRFAGATGGGDASGELNLAASSGTVVLDGTISTVGSSRGASR
jgi:hypothetical protein